jgi:hypothetical protein
LQKTANKQIRKANDKAVDGFLCGLHYYATKFSKNSKPEDTIGILHKIDLMNDSAKIYTNEYLQQVSFFNATYDSLMQRAKSYQSLTEKGIDETKKIISLRKENKIVNEEDLKNRKNDWQKFQSANNKLLFFKTDFLVDTLLHQFKRIQQNHFKVIAIQKKVLKQNKKLRRYKEENQSLIQGYLDVSNSMQTFLYRHNDLVRLFSSKCNHLKKELKGVAKISAKENEQLNEELLLEKLNDKMRSKNISMLTSAETKIVNAHAAHCLKQMKAAQKLKQKIQN